MNKPRVVKDYDKFDVSIQEQIKLNYPHGFDKHLILFKNIKGAFVSALPFETEEKYYLVRMTQAQARAIIEEDDDYKDGSLKQNALADLQSKHLYDEDEDDDIDDQILEEAENMDINENIEE